MVYRQRPFAGWRHVRWWWLAGLLGWLACGLASRSPSLTTAVLAILVAALPSIARGTPRVAVGLVGDRLTEWYPLGRTVATRLDDIEQVDVRVGRALCFAEGRVVVLDESLPGWREMADALRAALRPDHDQSASAHLVTPA